MSHIKAKLTEYCYFKNFFSGKKFRLENHSAHVPVLSRVVRKRCRLSTRSFFSLEEEEFPLNLMPKSRPGRFGKGTKKIVKKTFQQLRNSPNLHVNLWESNSKSAWRGPSFVNLIRNLNMLIRGCRELNGGHFGV